MYRMVYGNERLFTHHMLVVAHPSPDNGVELCYQVSSFSLSVSDDDFSHLAQECFHILPGWLD